MPRLSGFVQSAGALVTVAIGLSRSEMQQRRRAGQLIPGAVPLQALIDSGAECSCCDPQAVAAL